MNDDNPRGLAKLTWVDPNTGEEKDFLLTEGVTITIGRSMTNEISIREQHVSRQHAVISYQYGMFMISDLGSVNNTFVNDQELKEPFPLASGDVIRLYVPELHFSSVVTSEDEERARQTGAFSLPTNNNPHPRLIITAGPQEGTEFPLTNDIITIGRATANAAWEIGLQDRAVSRPHVKIERQNQDWVLTDLGSSNGTLINNKLVAHPETLHDGNVLLIGETTLLFRLGGA
jgi:pSer/pThr/pTyr-binding forkhead associated (FHA) protein